MCVREPCDPKWLGVGPASVESPPASFCLVIAWLQSCPRSSGEWGGGAVRAHLVLAASGFVGSVFLTPFLSVPSAVDEKGGQGRWDSGEVLPSEKPLESLFHPPSFYASGPSSQALYCLPLPLTFPSSCPFSPFPFCPSLRSQSVGLHTVHTNPQGWPWGTCSVVPSCSWVSCSLPKRKLLRFLKVL